SVKEYTTPAILTANGVLKPIVRRAATLNLKLALLERPRRSAYQNLPRTVRPSRCAPSAPGHRRPRSATTPAAARREAARSSSTTRTTADEMLRALDRSKAPASARNPPKRDHQHIAAGERQFGS